MSQADYDLIKKLAEKIRFNQANHDEYNQYVALLKTAGIKQEEINNALMKGNFDDINELYFERKKLSSDRIKVINRYVIPSLVGIGLGLALAYSIMEIVKESKKK